MPLKQSVTQDFENKIDKPWMTSAIKVSIAKKFQLQDKFRKTKLESDNMKYKQHRNMLSHLILKTKIRYYHDQSIIYGSDKSKTWKLINEIAQRKRKSACNIKKMVDSEGKSP